MIHNLFINWNPDLIALQLGPMQIRWYSLCWLIGLMIAYFVVMKLFEKSKIPYEKFEPLFLYCFVGILLGARLGHCLFYQPDYFLTSTVGFFEMFVPVKLHGTGVIESLTSGSWSFIGYEGLASHGGTIGLILALILYSRTKKIAMWTLLDFIAIATPTTACFIRLGNLMNSEIIGKPTDVPWAFIFERVDMLPRHPGQLYEAIAYAILFVIMMVIYNRNMPKAAKSNAVRTDFSVKNGSLSPERAGGESFWARINADKVEKLPKEHLPTEEEAFPAIRYNLRPLPSRDGWGGTFTPGVAKEYALRFRYKSPDGAKTCRLRITDQKGAVLVDRDMTFPQTPNKFKTISTTTGTQINAGNYRVQLIGLKDVDFEYLEVQ